ncbi:MAG: hypothetical protein ACR2PZ_26660 [Pseudomonadales bacterium]
MASSIGFSKYQVLAFIISPLCPLLFLLAYTLTEERYRLNPWISIALSVLPALLFSISLFVFQTRDKKYLARFIFLMFSTSIWSIGTLLGLFSVLMADDPTWFH